MCVDMCVDTHPVRIEHPVGPPVVTPVIVHDHQPQLAVVRLGVRAEEEVVVQPRLLARVHVEKWTLEMRFCAVTRALCTVSNLDSFPGVRHWLV